MPRRHPHAPLPGPPGQTPAAPGAEARPARPPAVAGAHGAHAEPVAAPEFAGGGFAGGGDPFDAVAAPARLKGLPQISQPHTLRRQSKARAINLMRAKSAADALITLPGPGESLHGIMLGNFSAWNLTVALLALARSPARRVLLTTLGLNDAQTQELCELIDCGEMQNVTVLVSSYFAEVSQPAFERLRTRLASRPGCRAVAARNHSKLSLLALSDGRKLVMETSANLRSSGNIEQFVISGDDTLFEFHTRWIHELIDSRQ